MSASLAVITLVIGLVFIVRKLDQITDLLTQIRDELDGTNAVRHVQEELDDET